MVRTILIPENTHIELDIPIKYVGKKIEITYLSLEELDEQAPVKTMSDFWGILSDETSEELRNRIKKSRDEWERGI